jgi:hypothetical protein
MPLQAALGGRAACMTRAMGHASTVYFLKYGDFFLEILTCFNKLNIS